MDQSDIFRLLLIVLLIANEQLSPTQSKCDEETDEFNYTTINDILILAMVLRLFASPASDDTTTTTTF